MDILEGALSSESAQQLLKTREELVLRRSHNDLLAVMSTPAGRRFVWELIDHCGTFLPSYASDALATSYNEGRRANGIWLLTRCQSEATDLYVTALTEHLAELRAEAATRDAAKAAPEPQENL